ncbi:hypothetical protein VTN49DRAFT_1476 [Thermomyces lanuginosus]|uniref:uncharacterized protein n=1 Tax=Thermomyces lanuginosus TaxID=5541 RepID=UPI0037444177
MSDLPSNAAALNIAETIQTASVNRHPSPKHDINPPTAATLPHTTNIHHHAKHEHDDVDDQIEEEEVVEDEKNAETASIPSSLVDEHHVLKPTPRRRPNLPPLPDLRFEQSYLASIQHAESWQRVLWITVRDQVLLPLVQGTLWTLALAGWRHWNRGAAMQGNSLGTRIRRWWYRVNNWEIPSASPQKQKQWGSSAKVGLGREVRDFFTTKLTQ